MRLIVYTTKSCSYDDISPVDVSHNTDFIIFVPEEYKSYRVKGWKTYVITGCSGLEHNRKLKILGHALIEQYDYSLYLDATIKITCDPYAFVMSEVFGCSANIYASKHFWRNTVSDEFDFLFRHGIDSANRLNKFRPYLDQYGSLSLYECGLIIRDNTSSVKLFNELWYGIWSATCRRDQLSFPIALNKTAVTLKAFEIHPFRVGPHFRIKKRYNTLRTLKKIFYSIKNYFSN
jgi:hypothetical protein